MRLADRHDRYLRRTDPKRKFARGVLEQNPHKPLEASQNRAMQHHGLLFFIIFVDIAKLKAFRQVKVDLHRAALPFSTERVGDFDVDLRSVKSAAALV